MAARQAQVLPDCYGLPVTTHSQEALGWYNRGVQGLLGFHKDTPECFQRALALDPACKMASGHLGAYYLMEETEEAAARARECFAQACDGTDVLTDREREVLAILQLLARGKGQEAVARMHAAVHARPREAVLVQKLCFAYFMQGAPEKMRDLMTSVIPYYENDSYMLGMYSFSLEETRDFARAFETGHRALALNPRDVWTLHALTHAYYETGAFVAGTQLLTASLPRCDHVGFFRNHIVWHLSLFLWEQGRYQQALDLYRQQGADPAIPSPPNVADTVSLLWRFNLTGRPTPADWQALTPTLERLQTLPTYLFNQVHIALGLVGANLRAQAAQYLEGLRKRVRPERPGVLGEVGVPLVEGLIAYVAGDYARTVELILPITDRIIAVGGSHAQREIFLDILADACIRARAYDEAIAILEEKRRYRPNRPLALLALAKAYAGKGEAAQAAEYGTAARRLWQDMGADAELLEKAGAAPLAR
ncbi:MAG: hypothetical protein AB1671_19050 [Thermodesulfobacteriota bacterium]